MNAYVSTLSCFHLLFFSFRLGKMYRYTLEKFDPESMANFVEGFYKNLPAENIPPPKTPLWVDILLFLLMNLLFYLTLSFSDDLVQLCVDYLREYPLLVGSGLACPVSFSFYTVNYFYHIFIQSFWSSSPRYSCSWLSCGWWREKMRNQEDPKKTKRRSGRPSMIESWIDIIFTFAFPAEAPRNPKAVRGHRKLQRLQKVRRRRRKWRKV